MTGRRRSQSRVGPYHLVQIARDARRDAVFAVFGAETLESSVGRLAAGSSNRHEFRGPAAAHLGRAAAATATALASGKVVLGCDAAELR